MPPNSKQRRTLARLFERPTPAEMSWDDSESPMDEVLYAATRAAIPHTGEDAERESRVAD